MRKSYLRLIIIISLSTVLFFYSPFMGSIAFAETDTDTEDILFEEISDSYEIMPLYMSTQSNPVKNWYYDKWFNFSNCKKYSVRYAYSNANDHDKSCASFVYYEYFRVLRELGLCEHIYTGTPYSNEADVNRCSILIDRLNHDAEHWQPVYDEPTHGKDTAMSSFYNAVKINRIQAGDIVFFYDNTGKSFDHVAILGYDLSSDTNKIYMLWQSNGGNSSNLKVGSVGFDYIAEKIGDGRNGFKVYRMVESMDNYPTPKISKLENVSNGVKISWDKVGISAKYRVYYKTGSGSWTKITDTTSENYTWTGATSGTTYAFTVRCISSDGKRFTSSYDKNGKSLTYVAAPVISSISNTASGMKITWGKVEGAAKYRVYYKTGSGKWTKIADTTSTSYTWKKAMSGTKYRFTVRCISSDGKSFTSSYDGTGKGKTYIAAPKLSSVSNTANGVKISWGKVTGAGRYRVYYKTGSGKWTKIADTTSTSYTWNGAKQETTYSFTVRCLSSDGKTITSGYDSTGKTITYTGK